MYIVALPNGEPNVKPRDKYRAERYENDLYRQIYKTHGRVGKLRGAGGPANGREAKLGGRDPARCTVD